MLLEAPVVEAQMDSLWKYKKNPVLAGVGGARWFVDHWRWAHKYVNRCCRL